MWRIRYFIESVRNLIRWFPVIWKDKDYDQYFLYRVLLTKIRHMRQRNEKIKFYVGHEIDAKWMKVCERLIENITESKYWDDEYDDKPINTKNIILPFKTIIPFDYPEVRDRKAKRLLFKILEWRIDYWWD